MGNSVVLVVDDSRTSRLLLRAHLTQQRKEWTIVEAQSGDEALSKVEEHHPDFVSMDVNMPGMNGLEAAGRIRMRHPDIRIALCTANIQESVRQDAAKVGIHFVKKPITEATVADMISYFEG